MIGVCFGGAFGDFEIAFVGHLVEGVFAAAEEFAGVAVAVLGGGVVSSCLYACYEKRMDGWMVLEIERGGEGGMGLGRRYLTRGCGHHLGVWRSILSGRSGIFLGRSS